MSAIKYYLQPNPITPDPNDQSARVQPNSVLDMEDIVKDMIKRGTMVTETDALAVVKLFILSIMDNVANGNHVNLPFVNIRPSIQGVFTDPSDNFDSSRHFIDARVVTSVEFSSLMSTAKVEKTTKPMRAPELTAFTDHNTSLINTKATQGGIGQLIGEELKYNTADAEEGIFFIETTSKAETKVASVATRTEGTLMFIIPAGLTAGRYIIEVRRKYTANNEIRRGQLATSITVS